MKRGSCGEKMPRTLTPIGFAHSCATRSSRSQNRAREVLVTLATPLGSTIRDGVLLKPELREHDAPLVRRVFDKLLSLMLPRDERVESASVEACMAGLGQSGYVANIQGNLAVSYNKHGLRIEPMGAFSARRKR